MKQKSLQKIKKTKMFCLDYEKHTQLSELVYYVNFSVIAKKKKKNKSVTIYFYFMKNKVFMAIIS